MNPASRVSVNYVMPQPTHIFFFSVSYFIKLHNKELHDLYSSPSIIRIMKSRRMRWAGHVARTGEKRNAYRLLVGKAEGKRPLTTRKTMT
jgi:hypothetical protein